MNKKDLERFARVEQQIIDKGVPHRLSHLVAFPYKNLNDLNTAKSSGKIIFGSDYNANFLKTIGTTSENIFQSFMLITPILIILTNIVLAIFLKEWILLLSIPLVAIGIASSSPKSKLKNIVSGFGGIMFIASFFFLDWHWTALLGSMVISQFLTLISRKQYSLIIEARALKSEVFFVYMFKNNYLSVIDTNTGKLFEAK